MGLKGSWGPGLGATVNSTRYSQCAKPASFAAVIYHVYAKLHMLSGMSGICILFMFHTHINRHLHWLFIDITDIQCWWVVLYMSKTVYCIFWDLLGILKTINSLHILDLYITPIMTNFLTSWHIFLILWQSFGVLLTSWQIFWCDDKLFDAMTSCWRNGELFEVMTNRLSSWRILT